MSSRIIPYLFLTGSFAAWMFSTVGCESMKGATIEPAGTAGSSVKTTRTGGSPSGGSRSGGILATGGSVSGGQGGVVQGGGNSAGGSAGGTGGAGGKGSGGAGGASQTGGSASGGTTVKRDAGTNLDLPRRDATLLRDGEIELLACDDTTSPSRLGVWYYSDSSGTTTQDVQIKLDLINFTAFNAQLSQVTVRYWFTDENPGTPNILAQYYVPPAIATLKTKFITLSPARKNADTVLEFSFVANLDASAIFVETTSINLAFHKDNYKGTYDLSNDYSVDPKLTKTLGKNPKITAYINGVLAWGCEPEALPPTPDAGPDAPVVGPGDDAKGTSD